MVGEGDAPVVAVLVTSRQDAGELISAPKGVGPGTLGYFSCKAALSVGAARLIMDPQQLGLAAPSKERGVVGRGHGPVVAVLLASVITLDFRSAERHIGEVPPQRASGAGCCS
jgi:hypothetical protein